MRKVRSPGDNLSICWLTCFLQLQGTRRSAARTQKRSPKPGRTAELARLVAVGRLAVLRPTAEAMPVETDGALLLLLPLAGGKSHSPVEKGLPVAQQIEAMRSANAVREVV